MDIGSSDNLSRRPNIDIKRIDRIERARRRSADLARLNINSTFKSQHFQCTSPEKINLWRYNDIEAGVPMVSNSSMRAHAKFMKRELQTTANKPRKSSTKLTIEEVARINKQLKQAISASMGMKNSNTIVKKVGAIERNRKKGQKKAAKYSNYMYSK